MTLSAVPDSHQLSQPVAIAGAPTWQLAAGHATSLRVRHASTLMVSSGRVWATFDGPHRPAARGLGDLILEAGERLPLAAGQRVVVEPLRGVDGAQACVALQRQSRSYPLPVLLREGLAVLRGAALGSLRGALAGARAARAASSASRAQGAMACGGFSAAP